MCILTEKGERTEAVFGTTTEIVVFAVPVVGDYRLRISEVGDFGQLCIKRQIDDIASASITYKDLRTGFDVRLPPSEFQLKIRSGVYDPVEDFLKITPEVLGTTKINLFQATYYSLKKLLLIN